jgi:hypothetical protein
MGLWGALYCPQLHQVWFDVSRPLTLQSHGPLGLEAERPLPVLSGEDPSRLLRASDVQLESFRPWRK